MNLQVAPLPLAVEVAADFQPDWIVLLLDPKTELPEFTTSNRMLIKCLDTESSLDPWAVQRFQVEAIMSAARNDSRALVVCNGGISRSTATGIGILVSRGLTPAEATHIVYQQRPMLSPNKLILRLMDNHLEMKGALTQQVQKTLDNLPKGLYLWCATCKNHFVDGDPNHTCPGWGNGSWIP